MKQPRKIVGVLAALILLTVAFATIVTPAAALQDLEITDHNLDTLNSFTYSGAWHNVGANSYLLKWYGGGQYFEPPWKAPAVYHGIITATIMADYGGNWWGECVSMAKNLAHSTVATGNWYRGGRVTDGGISPGTAIATFFWSSEEGRYVYDYEHNLVHTAIFRQYTYDSYGRINGMIVWDQNWYDNENEEGIVAMHKISKTNYGNRNDAGFYYVVQV